MSYKVKMLEATIAPFSQFNPCNLLNFPAVPRRLRGCQRRISASRSQSTVAIFLYPHRNNNQRVIPRLAKRAEGPHVGSSASMIQPPCPEPRHDPSLGDLNRVERSLTVYAVRDDTLSPLSKCSITHFAPEISTNYSRHPRS